MPQWLGKHEDEREKNDSKKPVQRCMKSSRGEESVEDSRVRPHHKRWTQLLCNCYFFHTEAVQSVLKDLLCAFSFSPRNNKKKTQQNLSRRCQSKPMTWKLCNHRSLLLLFMRFNRGKVSSCPCCVLLPTTTTEKCKKTCNWWVDNGKNFIP